MFGLTWMLALAQTTAVVLSANPPWLAERRDAWRFVGAVALMAVGLLHMAFSRDLLQLFLGWEFASLGLWLALRPGRIAGTRWLALSLHAPGAVLLAVVLLGYAPPFLPPAGGVAEAWPLPLAAAFTLVAAMRSGAWPFHGWLREAAGTTGGPRIALLSLYSVAAPFLLCKALVSSRWDPQSAWLLALIGTTALIGSVAAMLSGSPENRGMLATPALAGAAIAGLGLASASPLAAAGAVALMFAGAIWTSVAAPAAAGTLAAASLLLGGLLGAWAAAQGALDAGYGLVAALLLPCLAAVALAVRSSIRWNVGTYGVPSGGERWNVQRFSKMIVLPSITILFVTGLFPQVIVEWVLRPAVGAMAGGVGALTALQTQWGLGLVILSPQQLAQAALPATGVALAVALVWVVLYWTSRKQKTENPSPPTPHPQPLSHKGRGESTTIL